MYVINPAPHAGITIEGLQDKYNVGEKLDFSVIAKGYGSYCSGPYVEIYNATNQSQMFWGGSFMQYTGTYCNPHNFEFVFHVGEPQQYSLSDKVPIILEKPGTYLVKTHIQTHLITSNSEQEFSVIPQENLTAELENNEGVVTLRNQTYYFETPNYTNDAYYSSPQISFHNVVFTLFPSGFRGGLPAIHCGLEGPGLGAYYWVDSKFSDNTHELLHLFAYSPSVCNLPMPSMFSNHANPQAGLTFSDGKMKLLVSK